MGYGFGAFLLVVGLVLALAVTDQVNDVDLTMVGWIMALVGALLIVLTAVTRGPPRHSVGGHHDPQRRHPDRQRAAYRDLSRWTFAREQLAPWSSLRRSAESMAMADWMPRPDRVGMSECG